MSPFGLLAGGGRGRRVEISIEAQSFVKMVIIIMDGIFDYAPAIVVDFQLVAAKSDS